MFAGDDSLQTQVKLSPTCWISPDVFTLAPDLQVTCVPKFSLHKDLLPKAENASNVGD